MDFSCRSPEERIAGLRADVASLSAQLAALRAHRGAAGEPVAWVVRDHGADSTEWADIFRTEREARVACDSMNGDFAPARPFRVVPLYASPPAPAWAGEGDAATRCIEILRAQVRTLKDAVRLLYWGSEGRVFRAIWSRFQAGESVDSLEQDYDLDLDTLREFRVPGDGLRSAQVQRDDALEALERCVSLIENKVPVERRGDEYLETLEQAHKALRSAGQRVGGVDPGEWSGPIPSPGGSK